MSEVIEENTCRCDNCDWTGPESAVNEAKDLSDRLDPGGVVPAGECPECGCLAYLDTTGGESNDVHLEIVKALDLTCPRCVSHDILEVGSGYVEVGEWDGKRYEEEFDLKRYQCDDCGQQFWI
jgi:hypothetical protein